MNKEEFLQALALTPRNWSRGKAIRNKDGWCPLLAIARGRASKKEQREVFSFNANYALAGDFLSMERRLVNKIVSASDERDCTPELRLELLIACGLE